MKTHMYVVAWLACAMLSACTAAAALYPGFHVDFHAYTNRLPMAHEYNGWMVVKFVNGSAVMLNPMPPPLFDTDEPFWQPHVMALNQLLQSNGVMVAWHCFSRPAPELQAERVAGEMMTGETLPDLTLFFFLDVHDFANAMSLWFAIQANPVVEISYLHPVAPALPTTNLMSHQRYLHPAASNGYDVYYAWTQPGGDGAQVRMIDIEYDWYLPHEDLQKGAGTLLWGTASNLFGTSRDHGTASVGISAALSNSYGMQGMLYRGDVRVIAALDSTANWLLHDAISYAISNTQPGDVILLEQQAYANNVYCPVEYWALFYAAIVQATALDRIVIEPAGNGSADLDAAYWNNLFQRWYRDSRTLMIGAGTATNRARCSFSTYGSRVDFQGWGDWSVASLGYGDLYGSHWSNTYTRAFAGTSSASALAAGAAGIVQSYARAKYGLYLPPVLLRSNLVATGVAQITPPSGNIGPLPNLRAALPAVVPEPVGALLVSLFTLWCAGHTR